jgi:FSR family fosmidomycin resistance protein-like MFS transporter
MAIPPIGYGDAEAAALRSRRLRRFTLLLLAIEFLDELVEGVHTVALPLIQVDLHLSYADIGLLLSLPGLIGNLVEPCLGIIAGLGDRHRLMLVGGVVFAFSLLLTALSPNLGWLLGAACLLNPASGAFVSLAQTQLMDGDANRHEHNMARWALAGSFGVLGGQLIATVLLAANLSWRIGFLIISGFAVLGVVLLWRFRQASRQVNEQCAIAQPTQPVNFFSVLQSWRVWRWLVLLECSDLMLAVFGHFLALYFVASVGSSVTQAGLAVTIWTIVGLLGDFLLLPILEKVPGLVYLRGSAALMAIVFPAFLLVPSFSAKLILLGMLGFLNSGWYSILKGQLYSALPGQSNLVLTVSSLTQMIGGCIPLVLGWLSDRYGLNLTLWLLLIGPLSLLVGLPRHSGSDRR